MERKIEVIVKPEWFPNPNETEEEAAAAIYRLMTTRRVEAEWEKEDEINAMFDAAYEAHGKIDPEFAG